MDERALEALYRDEARALYNVILRRVWQPAVADELTQEAFYRLWRMRQRVGSDTRRALLYRIGLNLARRSAYRHRLLAFLPWVEDDSSCSEPGPQESLATHEAQHLLRQALQALPAAYRDVLLLTEFSDMSYRETATALRIAEGTVASRRRRALDRLRNLLAERGYDYHAED